MIIMTTILFILDYLVFSIFNLFGKIGEIIIMFKIKREIKKDKKIKEMYIDEQKRE